MFFQVEYQNWISEWPFWYSFWYSEKLKNARKWPKSLPVWHWLVILTWLAHFWAIPSLKLGYDFSSWISELNIRMAILIFILIFRKVEKCQKMTQIAARLTLIGDYDMVGTFLGHSKPKIRLWFFYIFFFFNFRKCYAKTKFSLIFLISHSKFAD